MRGATKEETDFFKRCRIIDIGYSTGNRYNAVGSYDEISNICGEEVRIKCSITDQDVKSCECSSI